MNVGQENEYQEFKESLAQLDKGIKSLTAMINKHGIGTVYFGVDDNGNVIGLETGKKHLDEIRNRIVDLVQPRIQFKVEERYDGDLFYVVLTGEGYNIPYSFDGRYFNRNIRSDDKMDTHMLRKALNYGCEDILKGSPSDLQELTFYDLFAYLSANGTHPRPDKNFFMSIGLLTNEGKFNKVAYLLSDNNNISLKVVRFQGKDKTCMSERTEYGNCSLLNGCRTILNYVRGLNITRVDLSTGIRIEKNLFDVESFKEAWINAVVHNDWINMIPPSVFIFDDRIEILSYGGLPYGLNIEEFYQGRSVPVNESLFRIFSYSDFAEQSGHGVPTIVENYSENAFCINERTFLVTIPFSFATKEKSKGIKDKMLYQIMNYISTNSHVSLSQIVKNIGISKSTVKRKLQYLQKEGYIQRIGPNHGGKWLMLKELDFYN